MQLMPYFLLIMLALSVWMFYRSHVDIQKLRRWMQENKSPNIPEVYKPTPDWTVNEAIIWRTFLANPTGQILLKRARAMESINAIKGANDVFHTQHSAGRTAGFSDAINWLESLASDQTINSLSAPAPTSQEMPTQDQPNEALR
jgi:hypothetical protein